MLSADPGKERDMRVFVFKMPRFLARILALWRGQE